MAEDKVIKTGQFTFGRLLFLAACGVVLFIVVAKGLLIYGYLLLTLILCGLLFVIAIDYGVDLDTVEFTSQTAPAGPSPSPAAAESVLASSGPTQAKAKRSGSKSGKRRR
ncbi:MAG TPA: hypothetical protein VLZ81_06190 [Blastocatellia bacterium]|nr:hypothetical protein [Blastocatellia bacterium]